MPGTKRQSAHLLEDLVQPVPPALLSCLLVTSTKTPTKKQSAHTLEDQTSFSQCPLHCSPAC